MSNFFYLSEIVVIIPLVIEAPDDKSGVLEYEQKAMRELRFKRNYRFVPSYSLAVLFALFATTSWLSLW